MANKVAMNGYLLLDSGGANSIDVSVNLLSLVFNITGKSVPVTAMGDTWEAILAGLPSWSAEASILYDDTAGGQDAKVTAIAGTIVAVKFGPLGSTPAGATPVWTGNALIGSINHSWTVNEVMAFTVSLQGNGAITRTTAA